MMCKCLYLKQRSKKGQLYYYCSKHREMVELSCFRECLDKEYKQVKKIKPVSKKRKTVSKKTYEEVFNRCNGSCALCGTVRGLELHHINGRGKYLTDDPNNCIMLCSHCHHEVVHKSNKYWREKLKEMV